VRADERRGISKQPECDGRRDLPTDPAKGLNGCLPHTRIHIVGQFRDFSFGRVDTRTTREQRRAGRDDAEG
jgi:hypothetical protein